MRALVCDPYISRQVIAARKKRGHDRYDEVWQGTYVMPPMPNLDHQDLVTQLATICRRVMGSRSGRVHAGANVSARDADWEHDYRVPDVVVVKNGGRAIDRGTHWQGGPDFVIEVRSPGDRTRRKLPFYAALGVQEVLVIDRDSRKPFLYRLAQKRLVRVQPTTIDEQPLLLSTVLPLAFRMVEKKDGPRLEVRRTDGRKRTWLI